MFNWQRKKTKATAWSGSTPQASGWATDPRTLLLHLLAKVENVSSPISGHNHKAREYINYALSKYRPSLQTIQQSCNKVYTGNKFLQHGKVYSRYKA